MRGKEYLLLIFSTLISVAIALFAYRAFAPELVGAPMDMRVVQLDSKVPPFFENAFRSQDWEQAKFLIQDPVVGVRGRPGLPELQGLGPHDLLGFRNLGIPNRPDVIVIGDSQTYGINALHKESYPAVLERKFENGSKVYSMALGGWSAPQYLRMSRLATFFEPQVVVVTLYTGNDILETFRSVYSMDFWKSLRLSKDLSIKDAPAVPFPPPEDDRVLLEFSDGEQVTFTPRHRLFANDREDQAVGAGLEIMKKAISEMLGLFHSEGIQSLFVIIPSKESAFGKKIAAGVKGLTKEHISLIQNESQNIQDLLSHIEAKGGTGVSLLDGLAEAISQGREYYPKDSNGHPSPQGYGLIADLVYEKLKGMVRTVPDGLYQVELSPEETWYYRVKDGKRFEFHSKAEFTQSLGSEESFQEVPFREISRIPLSGYETGDEMSSNNGEEFQGSF